MNCCFFYYQQVTQATNQIVMNCADIDIITASFAPQGGEGKRPHFASLSTSFLLCDCHYKLQFIGVACMVFVLHLILHFQYW